jgi:RNA recognition motif-containing protein
MSSNNISTQTDTKSYFKTFGPVSSYSLLTDKQTGKS